MKIIIMLILCTKVWAFEEVNDQISLSMVPRGKIVEKERRYYKIKTRSGTRISVELYRNGNLEEASGRNLNGGDDFEPGQGLISLSTAAKFAIIPGTQLNGRWILDEDKKLGWIYEFYGEQKGTDLEILVNARTGKMIFFTD